MDQQQWIKILDQLPIGPIRIYQSVSSTNQVLEDWARAGAPDLSLVAADEQTEGKGRRGRQWITRRGQALAFSLLLYPSPEQVSPDNLGLLGMAAALSVAETLEQDYKLTARIKWPNDVLLQNKKVCGMLVEAHWKGGDLEFVVIGIGVNVHPSGVPPLEELRFPATSLDEHTKKRVDRLLLMESIIRSFLQHRTRIGSQKLVGDIERNLAYLGQEIFLTQDDKELARGNLQGLTPQGGLRLQSLGGEKLVFKIGEIQLGLVDR